MTLKAVDVKLKTPLFEIGGTWEPTTLERDAAWEIYVQLVTRVAVSSIPHNLGSDREVLESLYSLFAIHRTVLSKYGVGVAQAKLHGQYSLGYLAVTTLNLVIRPFLTTWHDKLSNWESTKPTELSAITHERRWPEHAAFRQALGIERQSLQTYAEWLSAACNVPNLLSAYPT